MPPPVAMLNPFNPAPPNTLPDDWQDVPLAPAPQAQMPAPVASASPRSLTLADMAQVSDWQDVNLPVAPPEPPGLISEFGSGLVRGANRAINIPVARTAIGGYGALGQAFDSPAMQGQATAAGQWLNRGEENLNRNYAPSVAGVTDIGSAGDAAHWIAGTAGELAPLLGGIVGATAVGGPGAGLGVAIAQGGLQYGTEAAQKHNGDPAAVATATATGMLLNGMPVHLLMSQAGRPILERLTRGALTMGGFGAAVPFATPLAGVAAGGGYEPPPGGEVANSAASMALMGAGFGALGGRGARPPAARDPVPTSNPVVSPDQQVALGESLRQPRLPGVPDPSQAPTQGELPGVLPPVAGPPMPPRMDAAPAPIRPGPAQPFLPDMEPAAPAQPGLPGLSYIPRFAGDPAQVGLPGFDVAPVERGPPVGAGGRGAAFQGEPVSAMDQAQARSPAAADPNQMALDLNRGPVQGPPAPNRFPQNSPAAALQTWLDQFPGERFEFGGFSVPSGVPLREVARHIEATRRATVGMEGDIARPLNPNAGDVTPPWMAEQNANVPYVPSALGEGFQQATPRAPVVAPVRAEPVRAEPVRAPVATVAIDTPPAALRTAGEEVRPGVYAERPAPPPAPPAPAPPPAAQETPIAALVAQGRKPAEAIKTKAQAKRAARQQKMAPTPKEEPVARPTVEENKSRLVRRADARPARPEPVVEEVQDSAEALADVVGTEGRSVVEDSTGKPAGDAATLAEAGTPLPRSDATTNLDRPLRDLEDAVVRGDKDVTAASNEYGGHGGKTGKQHRTLLDWLNHRIAELSSKDRYAEIVERGRVIEADPKLSATEKKAAGKALSEELDKFDEEYVARLTEARDELKAADPDPDTGVTRAQREAESAKLTDHAAALREKFAQVNAKAATPPAKPTPKEVIAKKKAQAKAKAAPDAEEPAPKSTETPEARPAARKETETAPIPEEHRRSEKAGDAIDRLVVPRSEPKNLDDARLNRGVSTLMDRASPDGESIHTYLDAIAKDPVVRARDPWTAQMAAKLKKLLPKNTKVYTMETAADKLGGIYDHVRAGITSGELRIAGFYNTLDNVIVLDDSARTARTGLNRVFLHEAYHAATHERIDLLNEIAEGEKRMPVDLLVLDAIRDELTTLANKHGDKDAQRWAGYAGKNHHELVSVFYTEPLVRELAKQRPSEKFTRAMAELGYEPKKTLWDSFVDWTRKLLGFTPKDRIESFLDTSMRVLDPFVEDAAQSNLGHAKARADARRNYPSDPALRGMARALDDVIDPFTLPGRDALAKGLRDAAGRDDNLGKLTKGLTRAAKRADVGGKFEHLRSGVLAASTLDNMTRMYRAATQTHEVRYKQDGKDVVDRGTRGWVEAEQKRLADNGVKAEIKDGPNLMERYRTASERVEHRREELRTSQKFGQRAIDIADKLKALGAADLDTLAALQNDAGYAKAHLGPGARNDHLKTDAQTKRLADLQDRYDALPEKAKEAYTEQRDFYRDTYNLERDATLRGLVARALPDAPAEWIENFSKLAKTKTGLKKLMKDPDSVEGGGEFAQALHDRRFLVKGIARVLDLGHVEGDYFPMRRYGDWVITYGDEEAGTYGTEFFERKSQADARRQELLDDPRGLDPSAVQNKRRTNIRTIVPDSFIDEVNRGLDRRNSKLTSRQKDDLRDAFAGALLTAGARNARSGAAIRRQGIAGASTEIQRNLQEHLMGFSSRVAELEHGQARFEAIRELHQHADNLAKDGSSDNVIVRQLADELEKRSPTGDDTGHGSLAHRMRQFGAFSWVYSLMSPSQAIINTAEAHSQALAIIGSRHNLATAGLALTNAVRQLGPELLKKGFHNTLDAWGGKLKLADWDLSEYARAEFIRRGGDKTHINHLFAEADKAGLINHTPTREFRAMGSDNKLVGWWERFLDFEAAGQHAIESTNRSAILKTAFDLEMRKNKGDYKAATEYAVNTLRDAEPNYTQTNKARISTNQGPLKSFAAPIMQFKNYGIQSYGFVANLARESVRGSSPEVKAEARKALAYYFASKAALAGSITLIADPLSWYSGIVDFFDQDKEKPHYRQHDVRRAFAKALGPEAGEVASRGLSRLAGVDISKRAGFANMLNLYYPQNYSKAELITALGTNLSGAAGQNAAQMLEAAHDFLMGNFERGVTGLMPIRMVRDALKAGVMATKGVESTKGAAIVPKEKITWGDIGRQALGFTPSRAAEGREGRAAIVERQQEAAYARRKILAAWGDAEPADREKMRDRVANYNQNFPENKINRGHLLAAQKRLQSAEKDPRTRGLKLPKRQREALIEQGSFANVR